MTQNSDPRENAIDERVNGTIRQEISAVSYPDFNRTAAGVKTAVDICNKEHLHSGIGMLTRLQAHNMSGELKQHWENYYLINKEKYVNMV